MNKTSGGKLAGSATPNPESNNKYNHRPTMKTKPNFLIILLSISIILLTWADRAAAAGRTIIVDGSGVTVTVSSLNTPIPLTSADTIQVINGGTLFVDDNATIGTLTIGNASSPGNVVFNGTAVQSLTVTGDVALGPNAGNLLDMTLSTAHTIRVGGNFLASGAGTFRAGAATIEYNSAAASQNVTANIGGSGAVINYKNLILSGTPSSVTNAAGKNLATGVTVFGTLTITNQAVPTGGSVTYRGSVAALVYSGTVAQTTTPTEWPAAPFVLNVPVTINNASGVTLDSDKTIGAIAPNSLILVNGMLNDNGRTLTVQGNVLNGFSSHTALLGPGQLVLTGIGQVLSGIGNYGNVVLNNSSTSSLPISTFSALITQPTINGRLTVQSGKLALPTGTAHQASLLTYGGSDKAAGTYGASTSAATTKADAIFDSTATGMLTVNQKPIPTVTQNFAAAITYGTPTVTVTGTVTPPAGPPNFAVYGNGAQNGELISNVVYSLNVPVQTNLTFVNGSSAFTLTLSTTTLPAAGYTVVSTYYGGVNLAAANSAQAALTVNPRHIGVIPLDNQSKVYGTTPDPTLNYSITNSLVPPDAFVGKLSRVTGAGSENVGSYAILQGTLALTTNYTIDFASGHTFAITPLGINVTMMPESKVYGSPDPGFNRSNVDYTISPQLVGTDAISGALSRTAGETVGNYAMNLGNLTAGNNYKLTAANSANFTITVLPVTVNFDAKSKTYGDPDPSLTYTYSPALAFTDTWNSNVTTNRTAGQTVAGSPYIILPGTLAISGGQGSNYNITFSQTGKLTINKKGVMVTALSPSKVYGADVPPLVDYAGFITSPQNGVPGQTAPTTPATLSPAVPVLPCSVPTNANYSFVITDPGSDPNYTLTKSTLVNGTVTVTPAPLIITAQNQAKPYNGGPFPTNNYPVNYNQFVCSDTAATAFSSGVLTFTGSGATATNAGVYPIIPGGLSSTKYNITYVPGWVTISALPATTTIATDQTWYGGSAVGQVTNLTWMINQANGTAGANIGWNLLKVNGTLTILATSSDQFRVDMVTLAGNVAGLMAKFDPTRPFQWEIVRATSISGFVANKFILNYQALNNQGANLFANPLFNGVFSINQFGNSLYLNFTPMGSTGANVVAVPPGYDVGTSLSDTTKLLGNIYNSDVDLLYLSPSATTVSPQSPVTINLNVGNLKQAIVGVDAYINFDSRFFVATTGAGAPVVAPGGGVWNNLITKMWNQEGDLDTVVSVGLTATTGTSADGTVATIVLTPTKTAVGTSRVVFRPDGYPKADGTGSLTTDIVPSALNAQPVSPGRVMTDEITVSGAGIAPVIGSITATQVQPLVGNVPNPINVKNGTAASRTQTVLTSAGIAGSYPDDTSTASGPVVITINASDAGVGLSGAPTLVLNNPPAAPITVPCTTPNATVGPFVYNWNVPAGIAQGTWTAAVTASDTLNPPTVTTVGNAFTLVVNTTEVSGVVELQGLLAANRLVTFNSGGGTGASNQWDMTLNFVGGDLLSAGAFQDVASFAAVVNQPQQDPVSVGLRYGTIPNLPTLAFNLANQVGGVSAYIYGLEYGSITSLQALANQLTNPQRPVDVYIVSQLSPPTIVALNTYQSSHGANAAALTKDLLNDFNNIVLGPNIYDPVRFAGVCVNNPTSGPDTVAVNRGLLEDAYVINCEEPYVPNYVPGKLQAQTARELSNYGGGSDPALVADILADFDTLTLPSSPSLWPTPIQVPYDQGLYNQKIFLGVTLSSATESLLTSQPPVSGTSLTLLNQDLLQDAYPGQYQKAPLTPATVVAAQQFNPSNPASVQAFVNDVTADLNALINGGTRIYTPAPGTYNPNSELGQLLAMSSLTPDQQIRENRLLLELNYPEQLSQNSVNSYPETGLATFRLVQLPASATQLSAKTAWNLRVTRPVAATVNFVNNGVPGTFAPASDFYLRAGDMNGDNVVNLLDYNILRINYGSTAGGPADINGDGVVNIFDYTLLQGNYGKTGDPAVQ
jgi:hypothetical protein